MSTNEDEALFVAIRAQDLVRVRTTLDAGANVNAQAPYYIAVERETYVGTQSALFAAVCGGHEPIVRELLARGADPNVNDTLTNRSPLIEAASRGQARIVELLIAHNANIVSRDVLDQQNALTAAMFSGHTDVVRALVKAGAPVEPAAFEAACHRGYLEAAKSCIDAGIDVNATRALQAAAAAGRADMIRWLAAHGADVRKHGAEALHDAANAGRAEAVRALVELGVPVESRTDYGWTPLHLAAYGGNAETVRALLEAGADPKADDGTGKTALDLAVEQDKQDSVEALQAS